MPITQNFKKIKIEYWLLITEFKPLNFNLSVHLVISKEIDKQGNHLRVKVLLAELTLPQTKNEAADITSTTTFNSNNTNSIPTSCPTLQYAQVVLQKYYFKKHFWQINFH